MLVILKLVFNKMLVMRPAAILKYDVGTSICHFFLDGQQSFEGFQVLYSCHN